MLRVLRRGVSFSYPRVLRSELPEAQNPLFRENSLLVRWREAWDEMVFSLLWTHAVWLDLDFVAAGSVGLMGCFGSVSVK
jgi:hypothetical protein